MLRHKIVGLAISILFFCTTFLVSPFSIQADSTKLIKIISKDPSVVGLCFQNGISIFETYETFFLAQIQDQQEETIKELGIQYEIIPDSNRIKFGRYEFVSKDDKTFSYPEGLVINPPNLEKQLYIVQFIGPIKQIWNDILVQNNVNIGLPVDQFGLIVQTNNSSIEFLRSLRFVKAVGIYPNVCKMNPKVDTTIERNDIKIITMLNFPLEAFKENLQDQQAKYFYNENSSNGSLVIMNLSTNLYKSVIENQDILIINPKEQNQVENAEASQVLNINDSFDQNQIAGLKGKGEIVGVADTGLSTGDPSTIHTAFINPTFADKVAAVFPLTGWNDSHGHGTHVAGSILGTGNGATLPADGNRHKGMAPDAKLVLQKVMYSTYGNNTLSTIFNDAYNSGARIHSNSYVSGNLWGQYDTSTREIDQLLWDRMDMQILFGTGNNRSYPPQYGIWPPSNDGFHTISSYSSAKNCIAVGASQSNKPAYFLNRMAGFSSVGPTHDARIKPDVIAPGDYIRSTSRSGGYTDKSGTSMATPITAGSLALIRECFRKKYGIPATEIPASLLKASMINGCNTSNVFEYQNYSSGQQLFLSRSNSVSGFGRVDIKNSLYPSDKNWLFYNEYSSNGTRGLKQGELIKKYYVYANASDQPLKATLVWTDMPGTPCTYTYDSTIVFIPGVGTDTEDIYLMIIMTQLQSL